MILTIVLCSDNISEFRYNRGMSIELNADQAQAVNHQNGPALIVAGAGTGKTRVLVERLIRLIEAGVPPQRLLALTFTEKAAAEMADRINQRLGHFVAELPAMTFNAYGESLLRQYSSDIGLGRNFTLMGDNAKIVFLRERLDELDLDYFAPLGRPDAMLADLGDYFSQLKQRVITPQQHRKTVESMPAGDEATRRNKAKYQELARAYQRYIELCRQANVIDYDDQIYLVLELFGRRPNVLAEVQDKYDHIMVDEFQDTNLMQSQLVDRLVDKRQNLIAVGDDDQSIYGWRGATLANILDFQDRYPEAKHVTLRHNYRSTIEILDAAYSLIQQNNPDRLESRLGLDKKLVSHRHGPAPVVRHFDQLDQEISWIAQDIAGRIAAGANPGDMAVLARRNTTIDLLHTQLDYDQVDHVVIGRRFQLFDEPLVRQLLEVLRVIADPTDNNALYHTLVGPFIELPPHDISHLAAAARKNHDQLWQAMENSQNRDLSQAVDQLEYWRQQASTMTVAQLSYDILKTSGLIDRLYGQPGDDAVALAVSRLSALFSNMKQFEQIAIVPSVQQYVESLPALQAAGDSGEDDSLDLSSQAVNLLTIHKSKGLEWPVVYIADCSEGSFPMRRQSRALKLPDAVTQTEEPADSHLAEERRLMYVAMTRARDELILSHSDHHNSGSLRKPSRFINEALGDIQAAAIKVSISVSSDKPALDKFGLLSGRQLKVPLSILDGKQVSLSVSQAICYLGCPLNFYYCYILHIPQPPNPAAIYGSLLHKQIEAINRAKMSQTVLDLELLCEELQDTWPKYGFASVKQRQRAIDQALQTLRQTHQRLGEDGRIPVGVEQSFRIEMPEGQIAIRGRYDAIFPLDHDVEIVDYKTSTSVDTQEKAKSRASGSQQLGLYALAWQLQHNELPSRLTLEFVDTGLSGSVRKTQRGLDSLSAKLLNCAEQIRAGKFEPGKEHLFCVHPPL